MANLNRRDFLKSAAIAAAPAVMLARGVGANEKVNIGWIGVGIRGYAACNWLHSAAADDVRIAAICDTYQPYLTRYKERQKTVWGDVPATYGDYNDLLADKNVDAVFIMSPEHLHHEMTIAALKAGKHVYVEKPLAHTIEEGADIVRAARQSSKVVQVGSQNRSSSIYKKAKELVDQGMIGEVYFAHARWDRNSLPNDPAWRYAIPPEANPQNTDWDRFLGHAPKRPWSPERYFQWRLYWDYSGGIPTDLFVHLIDIVHFMGNKQVPKSCVASGGIYRWKDDREVADTLSAVYEYPGDFQLNCSAYFGNEHFGFGEQLCGTEGTIEVMNRQDLYFMPETLKGKALERVKSRQAIHLNGRQDFNEGDGTINHFRNFIQAVRGKEKVITPPEIGHHGAIAGHLATLSYRNQKKVLWDDTAGTYRFS